MLLPSRKPCQEGYSPVITGLVELTTIFTNQGLTAPPLDFTVSDRVRAGTTCRAEILEAFNRLLPSCYLLLLFAPGVAQGLPGKQH